MLSQGVHHQAGGWAAVANAPGAGKGRSPLPCSDAHMDCQGPAAQGPAASPSSDASCAMEYSCSLPATPAAKEQHKPVDAAAGGPLPGAACEGWFAKCRGCGCMTAHEKLIRHTDVPFCRRCQHTLHTACPAMQEKMVATLLYVHAAWSNAGL